MLGRPAIGSLSLSGKGGKGTAFAISSTHLLTAFHCVGNRKTKQRTGEPIGFRLLDCAPIAATFGDADADLDFALLELEQPLPAGWEPLAIARSSEQLHGAEFQSRGFPRDRPFEAAYSVGGTVRDPSAEMWSGTPALQLYADEVSAGRDPSGLSGAPVRLWMQRRVDSGWRSGWVTVGLMRWAEPDPDAPRVGRGGSVYACPLDAVAKSCSAVDELTVKARRLDLRRGGDGDARRGEYPISFAVELEKAADFVGREAVLAQMREFADRHDRGYFHVEASAGLGKSALAARLATLEQAPAFFTDAGRGTVRAEQCLRHLSAELALRHDLDPELLGEDSGSDFTVLTQTLAAVSELHGEPLWLVVDGLDEAEPAQPGANPLQLPPRLPPGIFVLLTSREPASRLRVDASTPLGRLVLSAEGVEEQEDLLRYVVHRLEYEQPLEAALKALDPPLSAPAFASRLAERAEANFMYVTYALADFANGEFDIAAAPKQLSGYYEARFWAEMERVQDDDWDTWDQLHRPVLACLAVAAEPVGPAWLSTQVDRPANEIRERVLRPWRRYLRTVPGEEEERWRIVHRSFADFLELKLEGLAPAHGELARRLSASPDPYAQRHLAEHLRAAGELEDLFGLVSDADWERRQLATDPSGRLLVHDIEQAWLAVEEPDEELLAAGEPPTGLGLAVWCALAIASVRTGMQAVPPTLVEVLVEEEEWTPERARETVRQSPGASHRAIGLAALSRWEPGLLDEALAALQEQWSMARKAEVLAALAEKLPPDRRLEEMRALVEEARATPDFYGAPAVGHLVESLPEELCTAAFEVAHVAKSSVDQCLLFLALSRRWPAEVAADPVARQAFESERLPSRILDIFGMDLASPEAAKAVRSMVDELLTRDDEEWRGLQPRTEWMLNALVPRLDLASLQGLLGRIETKAGVYALLEEIATGLLRHGDPDGALAALAAGIPQHRAATLARLGGELPPSCAERALALAEEVLDPYLRAEAIAAISRQLPAQRRRALIKTALPEPCFEDREDRANALGGYASYLEPDQAVEVFGLLGDMLTQSAQARNLAELAATLPEDRLSSALGKAEELAEREDDAARAAILERLSGEDLLVAARSAAWHSELGTLAATALGRKLDAAGREQVLSLLSPGRAPTPLMLLGLAPYLSEPQLETARSLLEGDDLSRLEAMRAFSRGSEDGAFAVDELVGAAEELKLSGPLLAHAVASLRERGRDDDALLLARAIPGWETRLPVLLGLAGSLDEATLREVHDELEQLARDESAMVAERDRKLAFTEYRTSLLPLLAKLPVGERRQLLADLEELLEPREKNGWLGVIRVHPERERLPADIGAVLYAALSRILHDLSLESRQEALERLAWLPPTIVAIGGPQAAGQAGQAILSVGHRWP